MKNSWEGKFKYCLLLKNLIKIILFCIRIYWSQSFMWFFFYLFFFFAKKRITVFENVLISSTFLNAFKKNNLTSQSTINPSKPFLCGTGPEYNFIWKLPASSFVFTWDGTICILIYPLLHLHRLSIRWNFYQFLKYSILYLIAITIISTLFMYSEPYFIHSFS